MDISKIKCEYCGGTKFYQTTFYYMWENETVDVATGDVEIDEAEREFMDTIEGWMCAKDKCYGGMSYEGELIEDDDEDEVGDELSEMVYKEQKAQRERARLLTQDQG